MPIIKFNPTDPKISLKQHQFVLDLAEQNQLGRQDLLEIATRIRGTLVTELGDVTKPEASELINYLKELRIP